MNLCKIYSTVLITISDIFRIFRNRQNDIKLKLTDWRMFEFLADAWVNYTDPVGFRHA